MAESTFKVDGGIEATGIVTATTFAKVGGTSSQFLKADGSVDTSTFLTTQSDTTYTPSAQDGQSGAKILRLTAGGSGTGDQDITLLPGNNITLSRNNNEISIFQNKKIKTISTHGTGCTLSSAIATYYSCGKTLKKSCELAIKYVNHAIGTRPGYGKGHGPINHLNTINVKKKFR